MEEGGGGGECWGCVEGVWVWWGVLGGAGPCHVVIHETGVRNKVICKHRIARLHETLSVKDDASMPSIILG